MTHFFSSRRGWVTVLGPLIMFAILGAGLARAAEVAPDWPPVWVQAWQDPPAELRPLQIVHGVDPKLANAEGMRRFREAGLGGIVCNLTFGNYLKPTSDWDSLVNAVGACRDAGMVVWIYDEEGYPSGAAGGKVLEKNPRSEALALAYDPTQKAPFILRPSYEHTHASNNFFAARRYPNLLDAAATRSFLELTHAAYFERLKPCFGTTVRATFTDEPSLMAVNIGSLGESVRKNVRVQDPLDESVKPLPSVPWVADLPERYRERYGGDLLAQRRSLFEGQSEQDRQIRRQYWALIADLVAERYFGQIQAWCREHGVASSGHTLHEEMLIRHVPFEGNALKSLSRMDIPGLDMLSSRPETVIHGGWMAAVLPASAAWLNARRQVMTEVSDFAELMATGKPMPLSAMQATASWQAALGVTEFTLYYNTLGRILQGTVAEAERGDYRKYCDHVGRLNALVRQADPAAQVLLYYPIYDLWAEYRPVDCPLDMSTQTPRARTIVESFDATGRRLLTAQIPFVLCDHEMLAGAKVSNGAVVIGGRSFKGLVLPASAELPKDAAATAKALADAGGLVMQDAAADRPIQLGRLRRLYPVGQLRPASAEVVAGHYLRDGRRILVVVNVSAKPYEGAIKLSAGKWWAADPASGSITLLEPANDGWSPQTLAASGTLILVGPAGS